MFQAITGVEGLKLGHAGFEALKQQPDVNTWID
jgi:hypothetical protein